MLALIDYVDSVDSLVYEYGLEYERKVDEIIGTENVNRDIMKFFLLESKLDENLNKIKKYAKDGYECYNHSNYISKSKLLEDLSFIPKSINTIQRILDELMITYEKKLEENYE